MTTWYTINDVQGEQTLIEHATKMDAITAAKKRASDEPGVVQRIFCSDMAFVAELQVKEYNPPPAEPAFKS